MAAKGYPVLISLSLLALCIISYVLLIILYFSPQSYHLQSLLHPNTGTIKPTVAVTLIAVLLTRATAALGSRCVEQSLWIRLASSEPLGAGRRTAPLTVGEARRLAQWSISPWAQVLYLLGGFRNGDPKRSFLLRIGGPFLIAVAIVSPVLLSGIAVKDLSTPTAITAARSDDPWFPRLDVGNTKYRGGRAHDNPTTIAALAAMRNLSAPVASVCDNLAPNQTCSVTARNFVALRAECVGQSMPNPDGVGLVDSSRNDSRQFCTGEGTPTRLCVQLLTGDPHIYSEFTTGLPPCAAGTPFNDCLQKGQNGMWGRLYGVWVTGTDISVNSSHLINTVDCVIVDGNMTVTQNGSTPPTFDRDSFTLSDSTEVKQYGYTAYHGSVISLNRIYDELRTSPYDWTLGAVGTGGDNTIYSNPMALYLLGTDANNDAETVARQIEVNFDVATLHAFARAPHSADLDFIYTDHVLVYVYDAKVLLILLVPLFATLCAAWGGRWRVAGDDVVVGYDPVGTARLGPVAGLAAGVVAPQEKGEKREEERCWVWIRSRQVVGQDGVPSTARQFHVVADEVQVQGQREDASSSWR